MNDETASGGGESSDQGNAEVDETREAGGGGKEEMSVAAAAPARYNLEGLQVEPAASFWNHCAYQYPRPIQLKELLARTDTGNLGNNPDYFPSYQEAIVTTAQDEIAELRELERLRDEPNQLSSGRRGRERCQISSFLQLRPQPAAAVINTARGDAFPVILTGRELARYFENETPGLAHHYALDIMIRETNWSPPRQGWVWAGLDVTIHSALMAAWYYKWLSARPTQPVPGPPEDPAPFNPTPRRFTSFRPRPIEVAPDLRVLYDRVVNSTGSGDGPERPDVFPFPKTRRGTPRHPSYPSGHSTYGGAASEYLRFFFPDYTEELEKLADNSGMARLWAGIHYRSDHLAGLRLGRTVARLVLDQMKRSGIPVTPPPVTDDQRDDPPPSADDLRNRARDFLDNRCGRGDLNQQVPRICARREPGRPDAAPDAALEALSVDGSAPVG